MDIILYGFLLLIVRNMTTHAECAEMRRVRDMSSSRRHGETTMARI